MGPIPIYGLSHQSSNYLTLSGVLFGIKVSLHLLCSTFQATDL